MPPYKAGQEVDSWCTKCKMDLTHRIIAVVDGKPVKVECRTCMTSHNYRAPKNGPAAIAAASTTTPRKTAAARASASRKAEEHIPLVPPANEHIRPYRMSERFAKNQWISHKNFGIGLVMSEVSSEKIEVRFDAGVKMLVHNVTV
jgi:hypothetical protein